MQFLRRLLFNPRPLPFSKILFKLQYYMLSLLGDVFFILYYHVLLAK